MRHTRSHTKNRRSHHALKAPTLAVCKNCGANHRPHHMCLECGFYNGRQVMDLKAEKVKRDTRLESKREAIKAQAESIAPSEAVATAAATPTDNKEEKK